MAFRVGQKVVCVDAEGAPLTRGAIYTINSIMPYNLRPWKSRNIERFCVAIGLCEVEHGPRHAGFAPERFRPVIEKSTDTGMAILREILDRETDKPPVKAKPRKSEVS